MDGENREHTEKTDVEIDISKEEFSQLSHEEKVDLAAKSILKKYSKAFKELAKK